MLRHFEEVHFHVDRLHCQKKRLPTWLFGLVLIGLLGVYAGHVWIDFFLCDDAYISFRYARHLAEGNGLVFNVGERVEGYTNFLWVLQLAGLRWLGADIPSAATVLSLVYTGLTLAVCWLLARKLGGSRRRELFLLLLLFLATHRSFAVWATGGLETRSFTFFVLLVFLGIQQASVQGRVAVGISLAAAAAAWTRPEGMLVYGLMVVWGLLPHFLRRDPDAAWNPASGKPEASSAQRSKRYERTQNLLLAKQTPGQEEHAGQQEAGAFQGTSGSLRRWGQALALSLPGGLLIGGHLLFRKLYYGQWVPNTYFAKVVRPWTDAGLAYWQLAFLEYALWLSVPLALLGGLRLLRRGNWVFVGFTASLLTAHALQLVQVGGDHFEFRPLDFYWPLLYLLVGLGLLELPCRLVGSRPGRGAKTVSVAVGLLVLVYSSVLPILSQRNWGRKAEGLEPTPEVALLRAWLPGLEPIAAKYTQLAWDLSKRGVAVRFETHRDFALKVQAQCEGFSGLYRQGLLPKDAVMAQGAIGLSGWLFEMTLIDRLGLTDAVVARHPPRHEARPNALRVMAHDRNPPPGYLEERGVNFAALSIGQPRQPLQPGQYRLLLPDGRWLVFASEHPAWVSQAFDPERLESWDWSLQQPPARGSVQQLAEGLASPSPSVRLASARALESLGLAAEPAVTALQFGLEDPQPAVRLACAGALSQLRPDPFLTRPLLAAAQGPTPGLAAVTALGRARSVQGVALLIQLLGSPEAPLRARAAWALGKIGRASTRAIPGLRRRLSDPDPRVRRFAAEALGLIGPAAAPATHALRPLLRDPSEEVAVLAAFALGSLRKASAVPDLIRTLNQAQPRVAQASARALGRLGSRATSAIPHLIQALSRDDLREVSAWALGCIGPQAVPALQHLTLSPDARLRLTAARALQRIRGA